MYSNSIAHKVIIKQILYLHKFSQILAFNYYALKRN